jgi:hypothetical protein
LGDITNIERDRGATFTLHIGGLEELNPQLHALHSDGAAHFRKTEGAGGGPGKMWVICVEIACLAIPQHADTHPRPWILDQGGQQRNRVKLMEKHRCESRTVIALAHS